MAASVIVHAALVAALARAPEPVGRAGDGGQRTGAVAELSPLGGAGGPALRPGAAAGPSGGRSVPDGETALGWGGGTGGAEAVPSLGLPDTLRLGERYTARFRLPPEPDPAAGSAAPFSRVREAILAGEGFRIEARRPALQLADSASGTGWAWTVAPTAPGERRLVLAVRAVVRREGAERVLPVAVLRREVTVAASPWQRISRFVAVHWTWLGLLFLLPTLGWLRERRLRNLAGRQVTSPSLP